MSEQRAAAPGRRLLFDAVLMPHRSLGPRGFLLLMGAIGGVGFLAGLGFFLIGAWPVVGFLGLEWLLVYLAFRINYRRARGFEEIALTRDDMLVRRVAPNGAEQTWRFQPYWLRVQVAETARGGEQLTLSSHGRSLAIGSFLSPTERRELAAALEEALRRLRCPPCTPLPV